MIDKTRAIVLRMAPYSKTSRVVTWLTPEEGKIATLIKGALRPRSLFLGQYDLFYTCELLYYHRERNGLHIAKECSPLKTRPGLRSDWCSAACASYACDMLSRVSYRGSHQPELYELAEVALDSLAVRTSGPQFVFWFELRLTHLLGLAPRLTHCARCKTTLPAGTNLLLSFSHGGLLCRNCAPLGSREDRAPRSIGPDVIAIMKRWQEPGSLASPGNIRCSENQLLALREILGTFVTFHMEINAKSREKALEILALPAY